MLTMSEQLLDVLGLMVEVDAEDPAAACLDRRGTQLQLNDITWCVRLIPSFPVGKTFDRRRKVSEVEKHLI